MCYMIPFIWNVLHKPGVGCWFGNGDWQQTCMGFLFGVIKNLPKIDSVGGCTEWKGWSVLYINYIEMNYMFIQLHVYKLYKNKAVFHL